MRSFSQSGSGANVFIRKYACKENGVVVDQLTRKVLVITLLSTVQHYTCKSPEAGFGVIVISNTAGRTIPFIPKKCL